MKDTTKLPEIGTEWVEKKRPGHRVRIIDTLWSKKRLMFMVVVRHETAHNLRAQSHLSSIPEKNFVRRYSPWSEGDG